MIFINFKTYEETTGARGQALLNIIGEVSAETNIPLIPVVQVLDLARFRGNTLLPLWVQHMDPIGFGAHTGFVLPEEIVNLDGKGVFLNHSEHPLAQKVLVSSVKRAKEVGLKTLVFAKDIEAVKKNLVLKPDFLSYEPPAFVGSTTMSVSQATPEVIAEAAQLCADAAIPLIVGAGVHSTEDVSVAIKQGAAGVAVATDIVKSADPKESLLKLLAGFN